MLPTNNEQKETDNADDDNADDGKVDDGGAPEDDGDEIMTAKKTEHEKPEDHIGPPSKKVRAEASTASSSGLEGPRPVSGDGVAAGDVHTDGADDDFQVQKKARISALALGQGTAELTDEMIAKGRANELEQLVVFEVYEAVSASSCEGERLLDTTWVDRAKNGECRSRLCVRRSEEHTSELQSQ